MTTATSFKYLAALAVFLGPLPLIAGEPEPQGSRLSIPMPEIYRDAEPGEWPRAAATIFMNFDGANLSGNGENAQLNQSWIAGQYGITGAYPSYGGGAKQQSVIDAAQADWAPFSIDLVSTRPNSGNYSMCMVGDKNPFGGGVLGVAPVDCNDQNKNNVVYAFHSANDQYSATTTATTISQEVAHAYGLEHVNNPNDIMNPQNAGADPTFTDQCTSIVGQQYCASQHTPFCPGGQQNSYAELMDMFGPAIPDSENPTVAITYPGNGEAFAAGADFDIMVDADDDAGLASVDLLINGEYNSTKTSGPFSWGVTNIPVGEYEFQAIAHDEADNETASMIVQISVTEDGSTGTSVGTSGDGDSGGDGGTDGGEAGGDEGFGEEGTGAYPPGFGESRDDAGGCACGVTSTSPIGLAFGFLLAPLVRRRTRR